MAGSFAACPGIIGLRESLLFGGYSFARVSAAFSTCAETVPTSESVHDARLGHSEQMGASRAHATPSSCSRTCLMAMITVALAWKWRRWAAATLACFYSMSRIGEFLCVKRHEVLTPRDLLHDESIIYIRFSAPKTRRLGAKVQYSTVVEPLVVSFLFKVWDELGPNDLLCTGSAGAYRSRCSFSKAANRPYFPADSWRFERGWCSIPS